MENFESEVIKYITDNKMLSAGDRVGIAVSGGSDSMALLHFLKGLSSEIGIHVLAVTVNHNLRKTSRKDVMFVKQYCADNKIECIVMNADVPAFAAKNKMGLEQAARILRYQCFETAVNKHKLTKFAVAHHMNDQAETILLHIFRGCGLKGASGMSPVNGIYIRPFLNVKKADLIAYNYRNSTPNVIDETNDDNRYSRNFVRNVILPKVKEEWRNVEDNIVNFGKIVSRDNAFINSHADTHGIMRDANAVRIPLNRFAFPTPVVSRLVLQALTMLGIKRNIEAKHVDAIISLSIDGLNGERVDLPNNSYAVKEYEYITIVKREKRVEEKTYPFKIGKTVVEGFGTITVTKTISHKLAIERGLLVADAAKLPKKARWRFKADGDMFTKFGGGTKKVNSYLTDKKIPARLRPTIPVLAEGSTVFVVGGVGISESVKTDRDTIDAYVLEFTRQ